MILFFLGLFLFVPSSIIDLLGGSFAIICLTFALSVIYQHLRNNKRKKNYYILPIDLKDKLKELSTEIEDMLGSKGLGFKKVEKLTYLNPYYVIYYLEESPVLIRVQQHDIGTYEYIHVGPRIKEYIKFIEEIKEEIEAVCERLEIST